MKHGGGEAAIMTVDEGDGDLDAARSERPGGHTWRSEADRPEGLPAGDAGGPTP